ncbi:RICIN domain-containing protein [Lyngbya aestuarii]|uniref:RICIN domain-containing protein n=1 Tax=Lyngbya aestuarii TaxID=118322 RepID=UPI00403E1DD3
MKLQKLIATLSLTTAIAATQVVYSPHLKIKEAWAQSPRPYVILVNGNADCCVWSSTSSLYMGELWNIPNAEFRMTAWDHFQHGGRQRKNLDIGVLGRYSTSNDADFIRDASDFINNQLAPNRPLVIIGHSYGGDSVIKLAHRVNRTIQFLGVIDPVGAGGFRTPIRDHGVPSNVDYFFNRWQENAFATDNIVPFDSRGSGSINGCRAGTCDQRPQNLARNADDSEIRVSCGPQEVTCEGWRLPGCNFGGCWSGSNGTKAKRLTHNPMPRDAYIQRQVLERVNQAIAGFTPPSPIAQSQISPSLLEGRWVRIQNRNWGSCLNLQNADRNGVGVNSWECVSHPDQEWKITDVGNGYVRIQNRNWGSCLNLQSADRNGVGVNSWECVSHPDQEWRISPL